MDFSFAFQIYWDYPWLGYATQLFLCRTVFSGPSLKTLKSKLQVLLIELSSMYIKDARIVLLLLTLEFFISLLLWCHNNMNIWSMKDSPGLKTDEVISFLTTHFKPSHIRTFLYHYNTFRNTKNRYIISTRILVFSSFKKICYLEEQKSY